MISVIITVFEQAASLEMLLYCLRAQYIGDPIEIIICDDGSSSQLLSSLSTNKDLSSMDIRYIWQSRNGHRASRSKNNGIRCAKGDILVFLDGDILVKPTFLSEHRAAHRHSKQIVCNPRRWVGGVQAVVGRRPCPDNHSLLDQFLSLAKNDIASLFILMDKISINGEENQQKLFCSVNSWMACIGFSFSIDKTSDLWFDEHFKGWGPEDRELVLRMVRRHNYSVIFREDIEVFHLEACSTGREPFSLPRSPSDIAAFLSNMIYFRSLYPDEDLSALMNMLILYRLNPISNCWELAPLCKHCDQVSASELAAQVECIEMWLRGHPTLGQDVI